MDCLQINDICQVNLEKPFGKDDVLSVKSDDELSCIKGQFFLPFDGMQIGWGKCICLLLDFGLEGLLDVGVDPGAVVVVL